MDQCHRLASPFLLLGFSVTLSDRWLSAVRTVSDFPSPGIQFKDLTPLLGEPALFTESVGALAAPFLDAGVTHVLGVEARGFWFGPSLALRLNAGFVPARKPGKLPRETLSESYALEYGTDSLQVHAEDLQKGDRVLIHDDVIATGGTAAAASRLVARLGANVVGYAFVLELGALNGRRQLLDGVPAHALVYDTD